MGSHVSAVEKITAVDRPTARRRRAPVVALDGAAGIHSARWEIALNKMMAGVCALAMLLAGALWSAIGTELAVPLCLAAFAVLAHFCISWLTLGAASPERLRAMRWINATIEASCGTMAIGIVVLVKGPLWAAASSVAGTYTVAIVISAARLRPLLTLYVTLLIVSEYLAAYHLLIAPRLPVEEVAIAPLAAWGAWERAFWLGTAGGLAACATWAARRLAVIGGRQAREKRRAAMLREEPAAAQAERRDVTVLFCDLRDLNGPSAREAADEMADLRTQFHAAGERIIEEHGGTVNRVLADGLVAVFAAPHDQHNHAAAATEAAHDILAAADELRARGGRWRRLDIGIGLDTGSAIPIAVARAVRLHGLSRRARRRIILSRACLTILGARANVISLGEVSLKGSKDPEPVYSFRHTH